MYVCTCILSRVNGNGEILLSTQLCLLQGRAAICLDMGGPNYLDTKRVGDLLCDRARYSLGTTLSCSMPIQHLNFVF